MNKLKQKIKDRLGEKKTAALKKVLNVSRIIKNIVCWTLIAVLTVAVIIFVFTKINGETPKVFGYTLHRIVTGSMRPELEVGDVIVSKEIKDKSEIAIGDIVTFQGDARFENNKVTHRVLVAPYDNGRGATVIVTKGDANIDDDGEISVGDVESKYHSKVVFLKSIYNFFFTPWGLFVFIFVLLLVFFDEIVNIVRLAISRTQEEDTESFQEIVERVKREQLEEMRKKQAAEKAQLTVQSAVTAVDGQEQDDTDTPKDPVIEDTNIEKTEVYNDRQTKEKTEEPTVNSQMNLQKGSEQKSKTDKNHAGNKQNKSKNQSTSVNKQKKRSKKRKKR